MGLFLSHYLVYPCERVFHGISVKIKVRGKLSFFFLHVGQAIVRVD